jgi:hypothetical protein
MDASTLRNEMGGVRVFNIVRLWCTNILYLLDTFRFYNLLYRCMYRLVLELRQTNYCRRILLVLMYCCDSCEDILLVVFRTSEWILQVGVLVMCFCYVL